LTAFPLDRQGFQPVLGESTMREILITQQDAGKKLENFLKKQFPIGYVRKVFRKNGARLNGRRAKPEDSVNAGDRLQLFIPFDESIKRTTANAPKKRSLSVIFEDGDILVIDKPPGVAVHEARGIARHETVIGITEAQYRAKAVRPQLVHRIDQDTSGILLLAKNAQLAIDLENAFETGSIEKTYTALLTGRLHQSDGTIEFALPGREGQAVRALTRFRVIQRFRETTLVEARIETGRMHQIRLHFAKLGYPVVMDERHGDFGFNKMFRKDYGLKRQFLHAAKLSMEYRGKKRSWSAALPNDLAEVLKQLSAEL